MSVISFLTTSKGNLPHLSYILRNPEPMGTELKTVACCVPGNLLFVDKWIGKEGKKKSK